MKQKGHTALYILLFVIIGLGGAYFIAGSDAFISFFTDNGIVKFLEGKKEDNNAVTSLYEQNSKPFETTTSTVVDIGKLKESVIPIEFADDNKTALSTFVNSLSESKTSAIRILHYGDSQIEGDRITTYFRSRLQNQFGGGGVGFISPGPVTGFASHSLTTSDNAKWVTIYAGGKKGYGDSRFDFPGSFIRFDKVAVNGADSMCRGYIDLNIAKSARNYHKVRLLTGNNKSVVNVTVSADGENIDNLLLLPISGYRTNEWTFENSPGHIRFSFSGQDSPDISGILLDNETGISVDNIPQRGSFGLEFAKFNEATFSNRISTLGVKLILFQYGVNAVPVPTQNEAAVENWCYQSLMKIKKMAPGISIIVLGVSDVDQKKGDSLVTNPNVEIIREAQKKAAFRAGCAFWDVYKAMGGRNSMASWVAHKPELGTADYIHFTPAGANLIAEMFYRALLLEIFSQNRN
jgi:hypothetical protein